MTNQNAPSPSIPEDLADIIRRANALLAQAVQMTQDHVDDQVAQAMSEGDTDEQERLGSADPHRWLEQGKHSLQAGLMFLNRAIHQPTSF